MVVEGRANCALGQPVCRTPAAVCLRVGVYTGEGPLS